MYFSVDRIIKKRAVLIGEDKKPLEVPLDMLPGGIKTGDMLYYDRGGFILTPDKAAERRERVAEMLEVLLKTPDAPQTDEETQAGDENIDENTNE